MSVSGNDHDQGRQLPHDVGRRERRRIRAQRRQRRRLGFAAGGVAALLALFTMGPGAAIAAPSDRAEAEGLFLSGDGAVDLDTIVEIEGAYADLPPGGTDDAPLNVSALSTIDLGLGVQLFGGNDVLTLGAVGQYAVAETSRAFASSGLVGADGAIQAGTGDPAENTTLDLTSTLDDLGVDALLSQLSLDLGALAAQAEAARGGAVSVSSDYQIASGQLVLQSPVIGDLVGALDAELGDVSTTVNDVTGSGGAIETTIDGLLGGLESVLGTALGGLVSLGGTTVTTTADVDLTAALDAAIATPLSTGPVAIDLSSGTITIDLEDLYSLNSAAPNTEVISDLGVNTTVADAIDDILTVQFPGVLDTAIDDTLDTTAITVQVVSDLELEIAPVPPVDLGDLEITVDGTVGGLLGNAGAPAPTVTVDGTLGPVDLGTITAPITTYLTDTVLPDLGAVVDAALDGPSLAAFVTDTATDAVTELAPVLDTVGDVVQLTVNVQEDPGQFRDPNGLDAGSFTQRAARIAIAPDAPGGGIVLDLASATVRAIPLDAPTGVTIDPTRGPVTGGTAVTIEGTNLDTVTDIEFGTEPVDTFTLNPDGSISTVSPPQAAPGTVAVTLIATDGSDSSLSFEYYAVTGIDDIDPDSGPTAGGNTVTITGVCFLGATDVLFDGVSATSFTVDSDTQITATVPAGTAGLVDVTVEGVGDCGDGTLPDGYTYVEPGAPTIGDIDPDRGPETGGTAVTITGSEFTGTTEVTFDGIPADSFTIVDDTQIDAVTPPHSPAVVDVIVTNASGDSAGYDFEFYDVTDISDVDPDSGPEAGGNTVTIIGTCFTGATDVLFDGTSATSFTVDSDTQITAVVPAGTAGTVDVTVVGAGDCGTGTDPDGYEYLEPPVVTDLDPTQGPETGGTVVTIIGSGFDEATGVLFDSTPGTDYTVVSDTEIEVTTPAHAPGVVPVTVQHPGGDTDAGDFEFLDVPTVTSIDPTQGPEDGGTVVTVTGEGFTGATGVTFDGDAGTGFVVDSDTQITVTTPPHAPATVPVIVEHPNGDADAGDFTFIEGTEIDDVTPPGGPEDGGTEVIITGQCFTGATAVLFGTTPATSFTVDSDTQITAIAPPGTGVVDVTVVGAASCGTDTEPDGYEYTDDPVIGTIDPTTGPETGGTVVTITGENLGDTDEVTFDGNAGTDLTIISDTEIIVTTPPGTPGAADVVVTSPAGSSDPGEFLYYAITGDGDGGGSNGGGSSGSGSGGGLASTGGGGEALWLVPAGILLLIAGGTVLVLRRRLG